MFFRESQQLFILDDLLAKLHFKSTYLSIRMAQGINLGGWEGVLIWFPTVYLQKQNWYWSQNDLGINNIRTVVLVFAVDILTISYRNTCGKGEGEMSQSYQIPRPLKLICTV